MRVACYLILGMPYQDSELYMFHGNILLYESLRAARKTRLITKEYHVRILVSWIYVTQVFLR
jgi:hypothetical protein